MTLFGKGIETLFNSHLKHVFASQISRQLKKKDLSPLCYSGTSVCVQIRWNEINFSQKGSNTLSSIENRENSKRRGLSVFVVLFIVVPHALQWRSFSFLFESKKWFQSARDESRQFLNDFKNGLFLVLWIETVFFLRKIMIKLLSL